MLVLPVHRMIILCCPVTVSDWDTNHLQMNKTNPTHSQPSSDAHAQVLGLGYGFFKCAASIAVRKAASSVSFRKCLGLNIEFDVAYPSLVRTDAIGSSHLLLRGFFLVGFFFQLLDVVI